MPDNSDLRDIVDHMTTTTLTPELLEATIARQTDPGLKAEFQRLANHLFPVQSSDGPTMDCGCKIVDRPVFSDTTHEIHFCPLHQVAEELLTAAEGCVELFEYWRDEATIGISWTKEPTGIIAARAAIAAATSGGEPGP